MKHFRRKHGFGLLEILITVAIIAVLATAMMKFYYGSSGRTPAETIKTGQGALDQAKELQKTSNVRSAQEQKQFDLIK